MIKGEIVRVWGKADGFEIEFQNKKGTEWECSVPADLEDGEYAVEIRAIDTLGQIAFWSGFLYMCNGICHVKLHFEKYTVTFGCLYEVTLEKECKHYV